MFPLKKIPVFLNGEVARSRYVNHHADAYSSSGYAWKGGAGIEYDFLKRFSAVLSANRAFGSFEDVVFPGIAFRDREFSAWEILAGVIYR